VREKNDDKKGKEYIEQPFITKVDILSCPTDLDFRSRSIALRTSESELEARDKTS
jgi:hypothetical protein